MHDEASDLSVQPLRRAPVREDVQAPHVQDAALVEHVAVRDVHAQHERLQNLRLVDDAIGASLHEVHARVCQSGANVLDGVVASVQHVDGADHRLLASQISFVKLAQRQETCALPQKRVHAESPLASVCGHRCLARGLRRRLCCWRRCARRGQRRAYDGRRIAVGAPGAAAARRGGRRATARGSALFERRRRRNGPGGKSRRACIGPV
mmetsp:Transcript_22381/g.62605  ORF Transcript_22381/g.62605 Transcript_22381/m.62605 type:complete len:208 (+) Transcript_22381:359-982(+)